ncbi:glutathione S-transferase N-terminal domain-containing protein [Leptospira sp. 96542]|nr:glutathione S-transferase N-terminal domain-containing protein [Leptospira sp. 96542]
MTNKLYIFPISHFSEKARWALDRASYPYKLEILVPGLHIEFLKPLVPETHLPVLQMESSAIQGSGAILDLVETQAFGGKATEEEKIMEEKIDIEIGKSLQTILYSFILECPEIVGKLFLTAPANKADVVPPPDRFELIALALKRRYKITPKNVDAVKQTFIACIRDLEQIYKTEKYFNGKQFGRVDLTVASLLCFLLEIQNSPVYPWIQSVDFPEDFKNWRESQNLDFIKEKVNDFYSEFRTQSK